MHGLIDKLNDPDREARLDALKELYRLYQNGDIARDQVDYEYVNNHIHTTYSFSPYSPSKALWMAFVSGLETAGIMDHDSTGGIREFIEAGRILNMATTVGMELRVDMSHTRIGGRRINNPDQEGIAYVAMHGIPHTQLDKVSRFIRPYQEERNKRNRAMVRNINEIMSEYGISIDFDNDILPLSMAHDGGTITERHLLYALSEKITAAFGKGGEILRFVAEKLQIPLTPKLKSFLADENNVFYEYDLLGVLKSHLVEKFYIPAADECPPVEKFTELCSETGAISAYAYLGDVGDSVTGDKKTQKFEDYYLELLFDELKRLRFRAVTYMPSRNTKQQLKRVKDLCEMHGFFQISGEDINSPRQKFICEAMKDPEFRNLTDATWALIGHETAATENLCKAMFSEESDEIFVDLDERIQYYKNIALKMWRR
ncbi:MAG: PHP domain-containing protein [Clostridiaceae bacterium]|nr:PHP domain-containing protein [Clostridiaceae bacterium]